MKDSTKWITVISVVSWVFISIIIIQNDINVFQWNSLNPDMSHFWTCMDGCYEMQLIYEDEFNITRDEQRQYRCDDECWELLIENEGDYETPKNKGDVNE